MHSNLRKQLIGDLGWRCLWTSCKVSAICLFAKLQADNKIFAHARLCTAVDPAPGGWISAVRRLQESLKIPTWQPEQHLTAAARKRSLARYRHEVVLPAVRSAHGDTQPSPPLPWAWIGAHADVSFPQSSFALWWQQRALGLSHPPDVCPWCEQQPPLSREHLQSSCITFATVCWMRGIQPEQAFRYPPDEKWFHEVLQAVTEIDMARRAKLKFTPPPASE